MPTRATAWRVLAAGLTFTLASLPLAAQELGKGGSKVTGSAGPEGAQNASTELEKCDGPKGTIAVVEPQSSLAIALQRYQLGSPTRLIRMMIQQSNCFQVERGLLGGLAGGLKFKQAQTSLLLSDSRSGIQVAAAEGSAEKADFSLGGALFGGGGGAALGGYSNTNEGKVIAASFIDNWNNIVRAARSAPSLVQARAGLASQQNAAASVQAGAAAEGDVMVPKIAGAKVLRQPREGAGELQTLARSEELLYLGEERDGHLKVQSTKGEGWVKKVLVRKQ